MRNFIQEGDTVTIPAPAGGVLSGDGVLVGALFGVAVTTAAAGELVEITTEGVFDLAKAGAPFAIGEKIYWDAEAKHATATAAQGAWIGVATADALASAAAVRVRLNHQPL